MAVRWTLGRVSWTGWGMDGNRIRILTEGNEDHEVGQDLVIGYRFQRIPVRSFYVVSVFSCKIPIRHRREDGEGPKVFTKVS